jgi:hypothetical protein
MVVMVVVIEAGADGDDKYIEVPLGNSSKRQRNRRNLV